MADFWRNSGYHLLARDGGGRLSVTDEFLRAYFLRPEMLPVQESCEAELALHDALLAEPRLVVPPDRLDSLADADARDNYRVLLDFRDRLLAAGTVEGCYLALFAGGPVAVPPLFIDQMAHVVLRNILDECDDPIRLRAAELLFRGQRVSLAEGAVMLADAETVGTHAETGGFGSLGQLVAEAQTPLAGIDLDVLGEDNAADYWRREERHDMALDVSFGRPGLIALCRVLESWIRHFRSVDVTIEPVGTIRDERWVWHIGLDGEATAILNDLYEGRDVDEDRQRRILSLFRLEIRDPALMRPDIAGRPVYLAMAMTADGALRLKPQNLLVSLPLADPA